MAKVLIQAGVVKVTQPTSDDLLVTLDRSAIKGAGRCAIGQFLLELQIYKATANVEAGRKLFEHYSEVGEPWLSWRSIILANKQPRKMFVQNNTIVENDGELKMTVYEQSVEGLIQSWVERFPNAAQSIYAPLLELSAADAHHFK